jgi:Caspase domain
MKPIGLLFLLGLISNAQSYEKRVAPVDSSMRQTFERQRRIAVLVGVGAYPEGSGLSPLKYPAQDVRDLSTELEKQGYAVRQITEAQASRGIVVRTLTQMSQALDPDQGTLLFYFSGHGFAQQGVNYLATYGVTVDDLDREGLSLAEVEKLLKASQAKRQVRWIDACRNDPGAGARDVSRRTFAQLSAAEGMRVLYSTRAGSVSFEDDSLKHGVFTYFLLRGLRGEAAGSDGLVTFQDLAGYVADSVTSYGVKTGRVQRPFEAGESSGDFLLAKGALLPTVTTDLNPPPSSGAPPADLARQMWQRVSGSRNRVALEAFLREFGNSEYAAAARIELSTLGEPVPAKPDFSPTPTNESKLLAERTLRLTPTAPSAEQSATIIAPLKGTQNYSVFYIDTRDFPQGGILDIEIQIPANSATDGSFDLFPANVPIPTRDRPTGTLTGRYDVRKGTTTHLEYRFKSGQVFAFGLEGNWFSPRGAQGLVRFRATIRR